MIIRGMPGVLHASDGLFRSRDFGGREVCRSRALAMFPQPIPQMLQHD